MAGRNTVEIILSARDEASNALKEAFGSVEESNNRLVGSILSAKTLIAGAFGALGGYIAKTGVDYDAMMEQSQVAWTTLLGSQDKAKKQLQDIANFAKATPFETEQVDAMAKYMFNAGYAGKQLFDQLMNISDVASAFNIPADAAKELTRQMSQVVQAGVAYTSDLDILQNQGVPIFKAIAKEVGTNVANVRQMASQGKITSEIYMKAFNDVAKTVKGASDAQSQTFSGMMSTLKDDWGIISGQLSKPVFDLLKKGLSDLLPLMDAFSALAKGDFSTFRDTLDKSFGKAAGDKISSFVTSMQTGVNNIKNTIKGLFDIAKGNNSEGSGLLMSLGFSMDTVRQIQGFFDTIKAYYNAFMSVWYDTGEVPDILAKIGLTKEQAKKVEDFFKIIIDTFKRYEEMSQTELNVIKGIVVGAWNAIKQLFSGNNDLQTSFLKILTAVKNIVFPIFDQIVTFIKKELGVLKQFWDENGAQIVQAVKNIVAIIAGLFQFLAPVILGTLKILWNAVEGVLDGALKIIMGLLKVFAGIFTGDWNKVWEGVKQILSGAVEAIWSVINITFFGQIIKGVGGFFGSIKNFFSEGWASIGKGISDFVSQAGSRFGDFVTAAQKKFGDIVQAAKDLPGQIGKGITDFIGNAVGAIGDLANELVKKFKEKLGINSPSKVFQGFGGGIIKGLVNGLTTGNLMDLGKKVFSDFGGGIMNSVSGIKNFLSGAFSGGSGAVGSWLQKAIDVTGVPSSWLGPLSSIAQHESSGNPNAQNHWDSNEKYGGTFGLMQMILPTFSQYAVKGLNNILDPVANAAASINYIKSRYGDIFNVPGIKSMMGGGSYVGYAGGTDDAPGGFAMVGENGPELMYVPKHAQIKTNHETKQLLNPKGGNTYNLKVINNQNMSEMDLIRMFQRLEALN